MKISEIKVGMKVVDSWFSFSDNSFGISGVGTIKKIMKTRVKIEFNGKEFSYDIPHLNKFISSCEMK